MNNNLRLIVNNAYDKKLDDKHFFDTYVKKYMGRHFNSNANRLEIYKQSINLFLEKPFFGHGISNTQFYDGQLGTIFHCRR